MAKLNEVKDDVVAVDWSQLSDQFTGFGPLPQPGRDYLFQMPHIPADADMFDEIETEQGIRLVAMFGGKDARGTALRILRSPDGRTDGGELRQRVTNETKSWEGEDKFSSQMAYLLQAVFPKIDLSNMSNSVYGRALMAAAGRVFKANVTWTANCSKKKDVYQKFPLNDDGSAPNPPGEVVKGQPGCGQVFALKEQAVTRGKNAGTVKMAIPQVDELNENGQPTGKKLYAERWNCHCGAYISAFVELQNIRAASEAEVEQFGGVKAEPIDVASLQAKRPGNGQAQQAQAAAASTGGKLPVPTRR
jgi:hypothetical protein